MPDFAAIARLEEAHCAATLRELGLETIDVAGGVACRHAPGAWVNRAEGMGLSGQVDAAEIARMTAWYDRHGIAAQTKICPFVDESLIKHLGENGFRLLRFEQLLFRTIEPDARFLAPHPLPPGYELRQADRRDAAACREIAVLKNRCFSPPGAPLNEPSVQLSIACAMRDRADTFGVYREGVCVAAGGVEDYQGLACLYGAVTDPAHRRRGLQSALIAARLNAAVRRGVHTATIGSSPGHDTERNVVRFGFAVAYSKSVLLRPRPS